MVSVRKRIDLLKVLACLVVGLAIVGAYFGDRLRAALAQGQRFAGPTSSQPIALSADDALLAVANPDNDSVTLFNVRADDNRRLAEIPVQREPNGVAVLPNGSRAYAANTVSGTVSVINAQSNSVIATIPVGTEPYGLALTPNGQKLYVTNARSNDLSVIDTATNRVIKTVPVGSEPRGIAISNNGDGNDNDETVYITQFLSLPVAIGKLDGEDDSKVALVTVFSTSTDNVTGTAILRPLADTGFKAAGDAIARIAPPAAPQAADFRFNTGAYPNQLNNIGIKGTFAFVPSTGASPNGPTRFDVNTQSLLGVINRSNNTDAGKTINMHVAVGNQSNPSKTFITQPWAIAFKNRSNEGYVVSAASNVVTKIGIDGSGTPTVQNDPFDPTRVNQVRVGKNPRGIVINSTDTRAYVMNEVSRNVTVLDLTRVPEQVSATMQSAALPQAGTQADIINIGKELYHTSIGEFDPPAAGQPPIAGRMSRSGWGSCGSCHPFGLTDNVVWIFGAGPRRTIPQHTDFDQTDAQRRTQRALNWSAIFDEEEDFEGNIRGVSGGLGLIVLEDGVTQDPTLSAFGPPANGGRRQLKVRGQNAWDAIKTYEKFGIRAPISPVPKNDPDVIAGESQFRVANCAQCHGGPQWTSSRIRFTPPPSADQLSSAQLINELKKVGTFDPNLKNEVRATAAAPLGADGFAPASLLSVFAFPKTFLHGGAVDTLDAVLDNVQHRSAGTGGVDLLDDPVARRRVVRFIQSIDARTPPINP